MSMQKAKVRGQMSRSQRSKQFEFTDGCEIMHKRSWYSRKAVLWLWNKNMFKPNNAQSGIEEEPDCFLRSPIKFLDHTGSKIDDFDPYWAFLDCNSTLNSQIAMECYTKLEVANWFEAHLRLQGWSHLSNPSDLPCLLSINNWCDGNIS